MVGRSRIFLFLSMLPIFGGCAYSVHAEAPFVLTGRWVKPKSSDTVKSIAALYGSDPEALAELNDLPNDQTLREQALREREAIFVPMQSGTSPGASRIPEDFAATEKRADAAASDAAASNAGASNAGAKGASSWDIVSETKPKSGRTERTSTRTAGADRSKNCVAANNPCLSWPTQGRLGTLFGAKESKPHDGIDLLADKGTLVRAAEEGDVLYSGSEIKGYGNLVILRHKGGLITVYAHNDKNLVAEGAHVNKGAVIAEVGLSGNAAFPHLHFEVRVSEIPRNPIEYLPARR